MEQRDITNLSVIELKALGYDALSQIELAQRNLQAINQEIVKKTNEVDTSSPTENIGV